MILSDTTIAEYLDQKKIVILPEFNRENIRPVGVRLHLGSRLLIPRQGLTVDPEHSDQVLFDKIDISEEGHLLKPDDFVLGSTYESFQVPRDMVCHIDGRSTVARLGLAIHCTSGMIDGNYEHPRTVVLEIKNQGNFTLILRQGLAIAMLAFMPLSSDIAQGIQSQYKHQYGVLPPNLTAQKR